MQKVYLEEVALALPFLRYYIETLLLGLLTLPKFTKVGTAYGVQLIGVTQQASTARPLSVPVISFLTEAGLFVMGTHCSRSRDKFCCKEVYKRQKLKLKLLNKAA